MMGWPEMMAVCVIAMVLFRAKWFPGLATKDGTCAGQDYGSGELFLLCGIMVLLGVLACTLLTHEGVH